MELKYNQIVVRAALLAIFAATMYADNPPRCCADKITEAHVNLRRKYSDPQSLRHYGVSYQQLQTIIKETSDGLLKKRAHHGSCVCFERELEQEVVGILQVYAHKHHAIKNLSASQVRQKIQDHELKLRAQYGKPDQLRYYGVSYQKVVDVIKETSRAMFDDIGGLEATESGLDELFRMHTDTVLAKLRQYRA